MLKKDYSDFTKEELLALIKNAEAGKNYGLVWEEENTPEKSVAECAANTPILTEIKIAPVGFNNPAASSSLLFMNDSHLLCRYVSFISTYLSLYIKSSCLPVL